MRLAAFIEANLETILAEWDRHAGGLEPGLLMSAVALRDHGREILLAAVADMRSAQTGRQQTHKARGGAGDTGKAGGIGRVLDGASELHAVDRLASGFDLMAVVGEYRALRASVLRLWGEGVIGTHRDDVDEVTRFNESIDQSLTQAVSSYTARADQSRNLFLAILSHDLRNPLGSIAMTAELLPPGDGGGRSEPATMISTSVALMARMIRDLLDYTRTRLGAGMPVTAGPVDLGAVCEEVMKEYRASAPGRSMRLMRAGDLSGRWDADRLRQAVSNLVGNALQHGSEAVPVAVDVRVEAGVAGEPGGEGAAEEVVVVEVSNGGDPIPPGELQNIFDPLVRGSGPWGSRRNRPGSIGLGLYIARQIALAHGGTLAVTSTAETGTRFTMRLPRAWLTAPGGPVLDEPGVGTM